MNKKSGARVKGWIKNNKTGSKLSFQYNPNTFEYSRGASYSEISAPGMSYPDVQYTKGNASSFSVPLFFYDNPSSGVIEKYTKFFNALLPPEDSNPTFTAPPTLTFCYGSFIRKCVLEDLSVSIEMFDTNNAPVQATITLSLRQVGL